MATYKNMNDHPKAPIEENFVAAGKVKDEYTLAVGPIRIILTKEEKEQTLHTWLQLDNGINPETNEPFTQDKLKELTEYGVI